MKKKKATKRRKKETTTSTEDKKSEKTNSKNSAEFHFEASYDAFLAHNREGYFSFLLNTARRTASYKTYSKMNDFFKPFIYVMRFFRILFLSVAWIQASALLLIAAAAALVVLPIFILLLFIIILVTRINLKYKKVEIEPHINDKDIIVFFRGRDFSPFFFKSACELAKNYTVLIVVPYSARIFKSKGMFFLNIKNISEGVIIMYEHCYFSMKNKLLKNARQLFLVF